MNATPTLAPDALLLKTVEPRHEARSAAERDEAVSDEVYDEAAQHILTPKRRRTLVSPESFAAMRRAVGKP